VLSRALYRACLRRSTRRKAVRPSHLQKGGVDATWAAPLRPHPPWSLLRQSSWSQSALRAPGRKTCLGSKKRQPGMRRARLTCARGTAVQQACSRPR
jgi:hypothetical protein